MVVKATMSAGWTRSNLQIYGSRVGDWLLPAYVWETGRADTMTVIYRQWTANGTYHPIKVIFREILICSSHAHKLLRARSCLCEECTDTSVTFCQLLVLCIECSQRHSEYEVHPTYKQQQEFGF
jgi:hypothetical protein